MSGNFDSTRVVLKCAIIAGFVCITLFPLSRTRRRARWAKCAFVAAGLIGITAETLSLMILMGCNPIHYDVQTPVSVLGYSNARHSVLVQRRSEQSPGHTDGYTGLGS